MNITVFEINEKDIYIINAALCLLQRMAFGGCCFPLCSAPFYASFRLKIAELYPLFIASVCVR